MDSLSPQLSVIICSIKPENEEKTRRNIESTISVNCEFITIDNRERKWPIAKAYNYGASLAKSPNLFFAHEDIIFEHPGWGTKIIEKLSQPDTGVIGFVGTQVKTGAYSQWEEDDRYSMGHVYFFKDGFKRIHHKGVIQNTDFRPALAVDGMGMFVPKKVWQQYPFDENAITGFHCYDIDFCLAIAEHYTNYVYFGADICHYSNGNMNEDWMKITMKITDEKWSKILPKNVDPDNGANIKKIKATKDYSFLFNAIRQYDSVSLHTTNKILKRYLRLCCRERYYIHHLFPILWQYFFKRILKKSKPDT